MLHTLAQAAVTVTETVTNTPSPTVPVEIIKQPSSGWEAKDIVTAVLSIVAIFVSFLNTYVSGPIARTTFNFYERTNEANPPKVWFSITNRGRSPALVDMLMLSNYKNTHGGFPVDGGDFPLPSGPKGEYELVKVRPGDTISVVFPLEHLENHRANLEAELAESGSRKKDVSFRDFYLTTYFSGREFKKKIPRRVVKKMKRALKEEKTLQ